MIDLLIYAIAPDMKAMIIRINFCSLHFEIHSDDSGQVRRGNNSPRRGFDGKSREKKCCPRGLPGDSGCSCSAGLGDKPYPGLIQGDRIGSICEPEKNAYPKILVKSWGGQSVSEAVFVVVCRPGDGNGCELAGIFPKIHPGWLGLRAIGRLGTELDKLDFHQRVGNPAWIWDGNVHPLVSSNFGPGDHSPAHGLEHRELSR